MTESDILKREQVYRAVRQQLISLHTSGITDLPKPSGRISEQAGIGSSAAVAAADSTVRLEAEPLPSRSPDDHVSRGNHSSPSEPETGSTSQAGLFATNESYGPPIQVADRASALAVVQSEVAECTLCRELVSNRTQTVFGVGSVSPRLCFVGEAPGADEDRLGEPFVGAAGKLLDKIIAAAKMRREEVHILNVIKCRPPGNRNPDEHEIENCWEYGQRQLDILQPDFICCLGSVAARTVLKTKQSIGRLRGTFHRYRGSRVVVTYHPAYLLRTPSAKRHVWDDMKMLMSQMGIEL